MRMSVDRPAPDQIGPKAVITVTNDSLDSVTLGLSFQSPGWLGATCPMSWKGYISSEIPECVWRLNYFQVSWRCRNGDCDKRWAPPDCKAAPRSESLLCSVCFAVHVLVSRCCCLRSNTMMVFYAFSTVHWSCHVQHSGTGGRHWWPVAAVTGK